MNDPALQYLRDQTDDGFLLIERTLDVLRGLPQKYGPVEEPEFERPSRRMRLEAVDFLWRARLLLERSEGGGIRPCSYEDRLERAMDLRTLSRQELKGLYGVTQKIVKAELDGLSTSPVGAPSQNVKQPEAPVPVPETPHVPTVDLATVIREAVPRTGVTSVQVSEATGIDPQVVCQVLRRLVASGRLRRQRLCRPGPGKPTWCRGHVQWRYYPRLDS